MHKFIIRFVSLEEKGKEDVIWGKQGYNDILKKEGKSILTEEGEDGGQVSCRTQSVLSLHNYLTQVSRRWTINSSHHINTISIWWWCSSCQLALYSDVDEKTKVGGHVSHVSRKKKRKGATSVTSVKSGWIIIIKHCRKVKVDTLFFLLLLH